MTVVIVDILLALNPECAFLLLLGVVVEIDATRSENRSQIARFNVSDINNGTALNVMGSENNVCLCPALVHIHKGSFFCPRRI